MNKKNAKGPGNSTSLEKTIAELFRAIEEFESSNKRPGEGILIEARELAAQWKINKRPLFEGLDNNRVVLLAALVQALWREHQLLKRIRRYRPAEFEKLIKAAESDQIAEIVAEWARTQPKPKPKQRYELERRRWRRGQVGLIELEFGPWVEKLAQSGPYSGAAAQALLEPTPPMCLDDIFAGDTIKMFRLEELFGMDRHRFAKALRGVQKPPYDYHAVVKIMDFLLEEPHKKCKRAKAGRPQRMWLNDSQKPDLRKLVLIGIAARIQNIPCQFRRPPRGIKEQIADAFLTVVFSHLPGSGKK